MYPTSLIQEERASLRDSRDLPGIVMLLKKLAFFSGLKIAWTRALFSKSSPSENPYAHFITIVGLYTYRTCTVWVLVPFGNLIIFVFLFHRITIVSDELSQILWSRVHPFLGDIEIDGDPHDHNIHGIPSLLKGRWTPTGLNNVR